jgi:hypothetical protein
MSLAAGLIALAVVSAPVAPALPTAAHESTPAANAAVPPTAQEVRASTEALVRARLRLPESLRDFTVASIAALPEDPTRFAVHLTFKARTPFGAVTGHEARFLMKRSRSGRVWIVTAP